MASVLELAVGTGKWNAGLKQAQQALNRFVQAGGGLNQSLTQNSDKMGKFVKMMGDMNSTATTAKGKMAEYKRTIELLTSQLNSMSEAQKKAVGTEYATAIESLKGKYREAAAEVKQLNDSLSDTNTQTENAKNVLKSLSETFGVNITKVSAMGAALGVTSAALKVAQDAFFASEANVDAWGRTIEAGKSLYEGFLFSLNTGDFGGFLSNIDKIISAAQDAYNALDRLGSMQRILAPSISGQQAETDRLRAMLTNGRYIAPSDGRKPTPGLVDGQILTDAQKRRVEQQLLGSIQKSVGFQREIVGQTNASINAVYRQMANKMGMSEKEFRAGTSSMAEFDKRVQGAQNWREWEANNSTVDIKTGRLTARRGNPYAQYKGWDAFRVDGENYGKLVNLIQQRDQQLGAIVGLQSQGYRAINRVEGITPRIGGGGGGGGSRGGGRTGGGTTAAPPPPVGSIAAQEAEVTRLTKLWREATTQVGRDGYAGELEAAKKTLSEMQGKGNTEDVAPVGSMKYYQNWLKEIQEAQQLVTTNNDWERYAGQIDFVTKKMKELRGESEKAPEMATGLSGMTADAIGGWINELQSSLASKQFGTSDWSQTFANLVDAETFQEVFTDAMQRGIDIAALGIDMESFWETILNGEDIPEDVWKNLRDKLAGTAKQVSSSWGDAARAIQAAGGALQQLENPTAKIAGMIGEAVANIALGFAQASHKEGGKGIWAWIAATAAGLGTMITTISAIKSATAGSYAEGGIVPGHNYSDGLIANVSSGELILNRAQQGVIANQLQGGLNDLHLETSFSTEKIRISLNNNSRRRGHGEYVTSR